VRKVELKTIDFRAIGPKPIRQPSRYGEEKENMIKDVTPRP
jgi:hypothetical protein